jgi:hypothetical protein
MVMSKKVIKMYLNGDKESNWDKGQEIGLTEEAIHEHFKYALYEVELDVEVDMETGETKILMVDGRKLESS